MNPNATSSNPETVQDAKGFRGCPAVAGRALDAEHERSQAGDSGDGTGQVQLAEPRPGRAVPSQQHQCGDDRADADRDVHPEDHLPAGEGGDHTADQDAGGDAQAADRSPHREALGPLRTRVGRHDDRQRRRCHQRGTQSLRGAGADQHSGGGGEPAHQGRGGEDREAGDQDPSSGQQIRDPTAEQQPAAGHQQVRGDHPLQVTAAQLQVSTDGRQCRVDHRNVQHHKNLCDQRQRQDGP